MRVPWWLNPWGEVKAQKRLNANQAETIKEMSGVRGLLVARINGLEADAAQVNHDKWRQARELNRQLRYKLGEVVAAGYSILKLNNLAQRQPFENLLDLVAKETNLPQRGRARVTWPAEETKPILNEGSPPYVCPSCQGRDGLHGESCPVSTLGPQGAKEPVETPTMKPFGHVFGDWIEAVDGKQLTGTPEEIERAVKAVESAPEKPSALVKAGEMFWDKEGKP